MQQSTSKKISYLQFISALMIIGLHTVFASYFNVGDEWLKRLHTWARDLFDMATATFFFLSAVLLMRSAQKSSWKTILIKKLRTIVVPYLLWTLVYIAARIIRGSLSAGAFCWPTLPEVVEWITTGPEFYIFWFLRVLLVLTAAYPLLCWCIQKRWPALLLGAGCTALAVLPCFRGWVMYESPLYWLPVFLLGCWAGSEGFARLEKHPLCPNKWGYVAAGLLLLGLGWLRRSLSIFYYGFWMVSPVLGWVLGDGLSKLPTPPWWVNASFFLYCCHMLVERYAVRIYLALLGTGRTAFVLGHIALPLLTAALVLLLAALLRWLLPWVYRALTGDRQIRHSQPQGRSESA